MPKQKTPRKHNALRPEHLCKGCLCSSQLAFNLLGTSLQLSAALRHVSIEASCTLGQGLCGQATSRLSRCEGRCEAGKAALGVKGICVGVGPGAVGGAAGSTSPCENGGVSRGTWQRSHQRSTQHKRRRNLAPSGLRS